MILGLDVSTSVVGIAVIDKINDEVKIVDCSYINLSKDDTLMDKAIRCKNVLLTLLEKYPEINKVFIEEKLLNFQEGKTNANSMTKLIEFNGIVTFICYIVFKIVPVKIYATSARKMVVGTIPQKEPDKKLFVFNILLERYQDDLRKFIVYMKKFPDRIDKKTLDISDALTVALAGSKLSDESK